MSIKIKCFGGKLGWNFKMRFPHAASELYIKSNFFLRRKATKRYMKWFILQEQTPKPQIIAIETINRCNSTCSFCPANKNDDMRPYAKMSDEMFQKIIDDLKLWNYKGYISLYVNNEPFIDNRIIQLHRYVREQLPECRIKFFTNGLLMTKEKFLEIIPYIDYMVINNYAETTHLHKNIAEIYRYVKEHESEYQDKEIKINVRYIHDILTNRAGEAPNKKATERIVAEPCLFPYTDMVIFSNGNAGICCNDATEKSMLGNVMEESMQSIWENENRKGPSYASIRKKMINGRNGWSFCKNCDTLDTGLRVKIGADVVNHERK